MDNRSEYLILFRRNQHDYACLLDANLEQIGTMERSDEAVSQLLQGAEELGPIDSSNWEKVHDRFTAEERQGARAYRLQE